MARGKSRSKGGRAESINTAIRGNRGRSKRGRRGAQSGGSQHTPATTGSKEKRYLAFPSNFHKRYILKQK